MSRHSIRFSLVAGVLATLLGAETTGRAQSAPAGPHRPPAPHSLRLYVFDCGTLHVADMGRYQMKKEDVSTTDLSVACYLIVHPRGTLLWDTGAVPDADWKPTGNPVVVHFVLPDSQQRDVTMLKSLNSQLTEIGYGPSDITYLALSHYHYDHTANANEFASSTWLVRKVERDAMFADMPPATTQPSGYSALRASKVVVIASDDYDVFGDGTVVIKFAPGHTPGHQVLCVNLAKTGGVVLSGDLYHFPQERTLDRVPAFDFDPAQTRVSRAAIDAFLKKTNSQLWIQHDFTGNAKLKKSPDFYE